MRCIESHPSDAGPSTDNCATEYHAGRPGVCAVTPCLSLNCSEGSGEWARLLGHRHGVETRSCRVPTVVPRARYARSRSPRGDRGRTPDGSRAELTAPDHRCEGPAASPTRASRSTRRRGPQGQFQEIVHGGHVVDCERTGEVGAELLGRPAGGSVGTPPDTSRWTSVSSRGEIPGRCRSARRWRAARTGRTCADSCIASPRRPVRASPPEPGMRLTR